MTTRALIWCAVSSRVQADDDKYSLHAQQADARAVCERQGWDITDVLIVPGFSRDYYTLAEVATAAEDEEVRAFRQLQEHLARRDFDVFIFFDADRLGRKTSLIHEVIGRIDDTGARLYSLTDGMIESVDMYKTFKAMQAEQDLKKFKERHRRGMDARAAQGKSLSIRQALFERKVRDEATGRELRVEVNEDLRPLWDDLAALLLERVGWREMERVLFERYGHGRDGAPYPIFTMRAQLLNPAFWGHNVRGRHKGKHNKRVPGISEPWVWDDSYPAPDGVRLTRHVRPAVYTGDTAERVKAELSRRHWTAHGRNRGNHAHAFTGLLACDECGYTLAYHVSDHRRYYGCVTTAERVKRKRTCDQRYTRFEVFFAYLNRGLELYIEGGDDNLFVAQSNADHLERRLRDARAQLGKQEARIGALISQRADVPAAADYYRAEIQKASAQIEASKRQIATLERDLSAERETSASQRATLERIRAMTLETFWAMDEGTINQELFAALGGMQLVVRDGEIVGKIRRQRRKWTF